MNKFIHFALITCSAVALTSVSFSLQAEKGFSITIIGGSDSRSPSVRATGRVEEVITDKDRNAFKIEDSDLKRAIGEHFGKKPNNAYVKSKTPWGDLYSKYKWPQVHRVTEVDSATILETTSNPTILSSKTFTNNSNEPATFDASISERVRNTTESNWSKTDGISVGQSVTYKVNFPDGDVSGTTSFDYSHTWGKGGSKSKSIDVGSQEGVTVNLKPGERVVAKLNASRGTMKVQIVYRSYLTGSTAVNYNPAYKGHHFWDFGIKDVMKSAKISNEILVTEIIEVGYYSDGEVALNVK